MSDGAAAKGLSYDPTRVVDKAQYTAIERKLTLGHDLKEWDMDFLKKRAREHGIPKTIQGLLTKRNISIPTDDEESSTTVAEPQAIASVLDTVPEVSDAFPVQVDLGLSLEDMIAAGKYDTVDIKQVLEAERSNFFPIGEEKKSMNLYVLDLHLQEATSLDRDQLVEIMGRAGYRPATARELLAFGSSYPDEQVTHRFICALGSIARDPDGGAWILSLWGGGGSRGRILHQYLPDALNQSWKFLAAKKVIE